MYENKGMIDKMSGYKSGLLAENSPIMRILPKTYRLFGSQRTISTINRGATRHDLKVSKGQSHLPPNSARTTALLEPLGRHIFAALETKNARAEFRQTAASPTCLDRFVTTVLG
jgi:hypothetical protein